MFSKYSAACFTGRYESVCNKVRGAQKAPRCLPPHFLLTQSPPASQRHQAPSNGAHPGSPFTFPKLPRLPATGLNLQNFLSGFKQQ